MSTAQSAFSEPNAKPETRATSVKGRARPYAVLAVTATLVLAAYFAFRFWTAGRENTDDAQVSADMVPIAARVGGTILAVPVVDHQSIKKGDLLAQIDAADYENKVSLAEAEIRAAAAQAEAADAQIGIVEASSRGGLSTARAALLGTASSARRCPSANRGRARCGGSCQTPRSRR